MDERIAAGRPGGEERLCEILILALVIFEDKSRSDKGLHHFVLTSLWTVSVRLPSSDEIG